MAYWGPALLADNAWLAEDNDKRRAFVAERGHRLLSVDYSQIELRLAAHMADVGALKEAFKEGADIHAMTASQVSAGRKNGLSIEIYGTKSSVAWNQERPDELWQGHRDTPNSISVKDPSLLQPGARSYADLPGGHSEGYDDTFKQVFRRFYRSIGESASPEYPQFVDGLRQMTILSSVLESHSKRGWVDVPALRPS